MLDMGLFGMLGLRLPGSKPGRFRPGLLPLMSGRGENSGLAPGLLPLMSGRGEDSGVASGLAPGLLPLMSGRGENWGFASGLAPGLLPLMSGRGENWGFASGLGVLGLKSGTLLPPLKRLLAPPSLMPMTCAPEEREREEKGFVRTPRRESVNAARVPGLGSWTTPVFSRVWRKGEHVGAPGW